MIRNFVREQMTVNADALREQGPVFYVLRRTAGAFATAVLIVGGRLVLWWIVDRRVAYRSVDIYLLFILIGSLAVLGLNIVAVWRALHGGR